MKIVKKIIFLVFAVIVIALLSILINNSYNPNKINSLMILIEFENIDGIKQWEKELDARDLTALLSIQDNILQEYPEYFKEISDKGYEIAGSYSGTAFWDVPYEEQYQYMKESKELVESITGKEMRVFGSRYFAYDENTLKAAQELGIEYILARGTQDVEAVIYKPDEYNVKIISVSNVEFEDMGRGSLCDYSLWARGSDYDDFGKMIEESISKNPKNMILVSHAYLGGTRLVWWNEYLKSLNSNKLEWNNFDDWVAKQEIIYLSNSEIPLNREVKYMSPSPIKEIEEYEAIPGLEDSNSTTTEASDEMICQ